VEAAVLPALLYIRAGCRNWGGVLLAFDRIIPNLVTSKNILFA
jgi:hypothetical protein